MVRQWTMLLCILSMTLFASTVNGQPQPTDDEKQVEELQNKVNELTERLKRLEPDKPKNIYQSEFPYHHKIPSTIFPVKDIMQTGKEISFEIGLNNRNWERPVYDRNWHSSYWDGRWSYMPNNLYNSLHRMFIGYQSAGIWFGLTHRLGLEEELGKVGFMETKVNEKAVFVIMSAEVKKIMNKGNQLVLISEPKRTGLQVLAIKSDEVKPLNPKEPILFQLVTPDGYEYDYRLDFFVKPQY